MRHFFANVAEHQGGGKREEGSKKETRWEDARAVAVKVV